jgi:predicted outer membrane repeat protein
MARTESRDGGDMRSAKSLKRGAVGAATVMLVMVLVPVTATAATIAVTCPGDSLQAAIDGATAGDTIEIASGSCDENITIDKDLTLTGAGPGMTYLDGGLAGRVVTIEGGVTVEINQLTVRRGSAGGASPNGGGMFVESGSDLSLTDVVVQENTASSDGGGIYMAGEGFLGVYDSTISGNTAGTNGGGIHAAPALDSVQLEILDSTIDGNVAAVGLGGGMFLSDSFHATLRRSTVSGNQAGDDGGGIYAVGEGALFLHNVTISGNTAGLIGTGFGGGIFIRTPADLNAHFSTVYDNTAWRGGGITTTGLGGNTVAFEASILTGNVGTSSIAPDHDCSRTGGGSTLITRGSNLFGSSAAVDCGFTADGTDLVGVNPLLGPLQDNGSPHTHALLFGSPAIDAVASVCPPPATDARGITRPQGSVCDIGAFEAVPGPVPDTVGLVDVSQGIWYLRNTAGQVTSFFYGNPVDLPIAGDWDGDGDATPGLYRQSDGFFYARNSNTQGPADAACFAGDPSDVPVVGDWDGDGDDNLGIYRPSEQMFYLFTITCTGSPMGAAQISFLFGNPGDKPVAGDWDGDGIDEVGLHRESTGFFYWRNTLDTGIASDEIFFGDPDDRFVAGDWGAAPDIDDIDTPAVFRPSNITFFFRHTLTQGNADSQFVWDNAGTGWLPVAGFFGLD